MLVFLIGIFELCCRIDIPWCFVDFVHVPSVRPLFTLAGIRWWRRHELRVNGIVAARNDDIFLPFLHTIDIFEAVCFVEECMHMLTEDGVFRDQAQVVKAARLENKMYLGDEVLQTNGRESFAREP